MAATATATVKLRLYAAQPQRPHGLRRFTRLTNAFSKKIDMHIYTLSLYFVFYNFVRTHKAHKLSPAMAAGVTDKLWSLEDTVALIDDRAPTTGTRGPYKKNRLTAA